MIEDCKFYVKNPQNDGLNCWENCKYGGERGKVCIGSDCKVFCDTNDLSDLLSLDIMERLIDSLGTENETTEWAPYEEKRICKTCGKEFTTVIVLNEQYCDECFQDSDCDI